METKFSTSLLKTIDVLAKRIDKLEAEIFNLRKTYDHQFQLEKYHMIRIKNGDILSDDYILKDCGYRDLTPEKAVEFYQNQDADFIMIDVSNKDYTPHGEFKEVHKVPLESLEMRLSSFKNKGASYLIISEDGTRSIKACKLMAKHGFYNLNNISGGYKFWPEFRQVSKKPELNVA